MSADAVGAPPVKRSHSPDHDALTSLPTFTAAKRLCVREARPELADAFLESLPASDLVHIVRQLEQLLEGTPHAADARALIYPDDMEERLSQRPLASAALMRPEPPTRTSSMPALPNTSVAAAPDAATPRATAAGASTVPEPSAGRLYTPSIPAPASATASPTAAASAPSARVPALDHPLSRSVTDSVPGEAPARDALPSPTVAAPLPNAPDMPSGGSGNISSRIAAILESIQSTSTTGPMLGVQGQPLAPSRQGTSAPLSSGLSSLLSQASMAQPRTPANAALSKLLDTSATQASGVGGGPESSLTSSADALALARQSLASSSFEYTGLTRTPGVPTSAGVPASMTSTSVPSFTPTYGLPDRHAADDGSHASRDAPRITSTLPSYEDMIIEGLQAIGDVNGTPPRMLFHWMEDTYPLMKNFRPSASQALQKAFKRGRLHKAGSLYRINPHWDGSNAGRKPTRRPQIGKDHPMMVNGPKGPAPSSPFKARAQYEGAAAYRQSSVHLNKQRHLRTPSSLRPGPKPYGQPGAAPLDNPASSIFQNGAAAAALLLSHQQRLRSGQGDTAGSQDLTPSLSNLIQQLRTSHTGPDGEAPTPSSLSSVLASALLKHAQRPSDGRAPAAEAPVLPMALSNPVAVASSPVLQSLSRLLGSSRTAPAESAPGEAMAGASERVGAGADDASVHGLPSSASLTASIETLVRQASSAAQQQAQAEMAASLAPGRSDVGTQASAASTSTPSQSDLDAAVSQTLQAAFQQLGPASDKGPGESSPELMVDGLDAGDLSGINLEDYSDALRTLTAALAGAGGKPGGEDMDDEEAQRLADEQAIADAEADFSDHGGDGSDGELDGEHDAEHDAHQPLNAELSASSSSAEGKSAGHGADSVTITQEGQQNASPDGEQDSESTARMEALLKSYGIEMSSGALRHLTHTLRDPGSTVVSELAESRVAASQDPASPLPQAETSDAADAPADADVGGATAVAAVSADHDGTAADADRDQSIQSHLEALIASLTAEAMQESES